MGDKQQAEPDDMCRLRSLAASLYGQHDLADCELRFCIHGSDGPPAHIKNSRTTDASSNSIMLTEGPRFLGKPFPAHSMVLAASSEVFKAQLFRWSNGKDTRPKKNALDVLKQLWWSRDKDMQQSFAAPTAADSASSSSKKRSRDQRCVLVSLASEDHLPAAQEVVRFMYTGELQSNTFEGLVEVYKQADYLQSDACVAACKEAIKKLPVDKQLALNLFQDHSQHLREEPQLQDLVKRCSDFLVLYLGDVRKTLARCSEAHKKLLELPVAGLAAVLKSDQLQADHENTVLAMLAEWVDHHKPGPVEMAELCSHIRLLQLCDLYFFQVLPCLSWFRMTKAIFGAFGQARSDIAKASAVPNANAVQDDARLKGLGWARPSRTSYAAATSPTVNLCCNIPAEKLQTLLKDFQQQHKAKPSEATSTWYHMEPSEIMAGFEWKVYLHMESLQGGSSTQQRTMDVGFKCGLRYPAAIAKHGCSSHSGFARFSFNLSLCTGQFTFCILSGSLLLNSV